MKNAIETKEKLSDKNFTLEISYDEVNDLAERFDKLGALIYALNALSTDPSEIDHERLGWLVNMAWDQYDEIKKIIEPIWIG